MSEPRYVEIQVTSHFSFLRGASSCEELFAQAALAGIEAVAVVDRNSLAGIVRAHEAAKTTGVRLIVGCRLDLADGMSVLVYPTDRPAYSRLCRLLSLGKGRGGKAKCILEWPDLVAYGDGLRSTERTYMASVSWQYPQDQLIALRRQNAEAQAAQPVASGVDLANVNFRYAIEGDRAPWRPLRAFDDGRQVFIEFPRGIGQGEMPPLFVVGPEGNTSELVNYRVRGHHMIVDRLFAAAELRFGSGREQKRVRIFRTDGRPTS